MSAVADVPAAAAQRAPLATGTLALLLAWPLVVLGAGSVIGKRYFDMALAEALQYRPQVAVLDERAVILSTDAAATPGERARTGIARAQQMAERLKDAGFVVLDHRSVHAAPAEVQVRP